MKSWFFGFMALVATVLPVSDVFADQIQGKLVLANIHHDSGESGIVPAIEVRNSEGSQTLHFIHPGSNPHALCRLLGQTRSTDFAKTSFDVERVFLPGGQVSSSATGSVHEFPGRWVERVPKRPVVKVSKNGKLRMKKSKSYVHRLECE